MSIAFLLACLYPLALIWAAVSDLTTMTIPNRLTIGLAVVFMPVALLMHLGLQGWGIHLGLGLAGLVLGMTLFALRFMGGGDAKLIAAASLWLGFEGFIALIVYTAIFGGLLTLALLGLRRFFSLYAPKLPPWLGQHLEPTTGIPYGIAICAGGIAAIWRSDFLGFLVPH
ncbi:MAG: prepilin peptidase [Asticcacaulis sp.]|uniref:A24 family peptidase n=1 Tax=Asticcacaulis sp. TaxID=1872648 RepID=UPI0039E45B11